MEQALKKKLIKSSIITTSVVAPFAISLGVYFGTLDRVVAQKPYKAISAADMFFDKEILKDSNIMSNNIIHYSSGKPDPNQQFLETLVDLNAVQSTESFDRLTKNDENGNKIITTFTSTDLRRVLPHQKLFDEHGKESPLIAENVQQELKRVVYSKMHNDIEKFLLNNQSKSYGVYFYKDANKRQLVVKLYELEKASNEEVAVINDFMAKIGTVDINSIIQNGQVNPNKFVEMYSGENALGQSNAENFYRLGRGSILSSKPVTSMDEITEKMGGDAWARSNLEDSTFRNDDGKHDFPIHGVLFTSGTQVHQFTELLAKGWFVTAISSPNFNAGTFNINLNFYKLTRESIIRSSSLDDKPIQFSKKITRTIQTPLALFGSTNPISVKKLDDDGKETSEDMTEDEMVQTIKQMLIGEKQSDGTWSESIYHSYLTKRKLVDTGLDMLNVSIPSVGTDINNFKNMIRIFNDNQTVKDTLTDEKILGYIHALESNVYVDASSAFKTAFRDFKYGQTHAKSDDDFFWSSLSSLTGMKADNGGQFKLYTLMAATHSLSDFLSSKTDFETRIHVEASAASDGIIDKLLKFLSDNGALPEFMREDSDPNNRNREKLQVLRKDGTIDGTATLRNIMSDWKHIVPRIVNQLATKEDLQYPRELILKVLDMLPVPLISDNQEKIIDPLIEFLNHNGLKNLMELVSGSKSNIDFLNDLFVGGFTKENLFKMLPGILAKRDIKADVVLSVSKFLIGTHLLPSAIENYLPKNDAEVKNLVQIISGGAGEDLINIINEMLKNGLVVDDDHINKFAALIEKFKGIYSSTLSGIDSHNFARSIINVLNDGLKNLDANTISSILSIVDQLLPDSLNLDADTLKMMVDGIFNKGIQTLTLDNFKKIFSLFSSMPFMEGKDSDVFASLIFHVLHGWDSYDNFKSELSTAFGVSVPGILDDVAKELFGEPGIDSGGIKDFFTLRGQIDRALSVEAQRGLHELLHNGLFGKFGNQDGDEAKASDDPIRGLIQNDHSLTDFLNHLNSDLSGTIVGIASGLVSSVGDALNSLHTIIGKINTPAISKLIYDLTHSGIVHSESSNYNPNNADGLTEEDFSQLKKLINSFAPGIVEPGMLDLVFGFIQDGMPNDPVQIDELLNLIFSFIPGVSDSIKETIGNIVIRALIGDSNMESKRAEVKTIFNTAYGKIPQEIKPKDSHTGLPADIEPYQKLKARADNLKSLIDGGHGSIMEIISAAAEMKSIVGKMTQYNDLITIVNELHDATSYTIPTQHISQTAQGDDDAKNAQTLLAYLTQKLIDAKATSIPIMTKDAIAQKIALVEGIEHEIDSFIDLDLKNTQDYQTFKNQLANIQKHYGGIRGITDLVKPFQDFVEEQLQQQNLGDGVASGFIRDPADEIIKNALKIFFPFAQRWDDLGGKQKGAFILLLINDANKDKNSFHDFVWKQEGLLDGSQFGNVNVQGVYEFGKSLDDSIESIETKATAIMAFSGTIKVVDTTSLVAHHIDIHQIEGVDSDFDFTALLTELNKHIDEYKVATTIATENNALTQMIDIMNKIKHNNELIQQAENIFEQIDFLKNLDLSTLVDPSFNAGSSTDEYHTSLTYAQGIIVDLKDKLTKFMGKFDFTNGITAANIKELEGVTKVLEASRASGDLKTLLSQIAKPISESNWATNVHAHADGVKNSLSSKIGESPVHSFFVGIRAKLAEIGVHDLGEAVSKGHRVVEVMESFIKEFTNNDQVITDLLHPLSSGGVSFSRDGELGSRENSGHHLSLIHIIFHSGNENAHSFDEAGAQGIHNSATNVHDIYDYYQHNSGGHHEIADIFHRLNELFPS